MIRSNESFLQILAQSYAKDYKTIKVLENPQQKKKYKSLKTIPLYKDKKLPQKWTHFTIVSFEMQVTTSQMETYTEDVPQKTFEIR